MKKDGMYNAEELAEAERQIHDAITNHDGRPHSCSPFKYSELDCGNINILGPDGRALCTCYNAVDAVIVVKLMTLGNNEIQNVIRQKGMEAIMREAHG